MRWQGRKGSSNIEDRRGGKAARAGGGAGLGILLIVLVGWLFGVDASFLLNQDNTVATSTGNVGALDAGEEEAAAQFVSVVLADTETVWSDIFDEQVGRPYEEPILVLFSGVTQSPCGGASGATGPFYCPVDQKAYLDTAFFAQMRRQFGVKGDFAAAYVVAHEIAHHVQNQLGILGQAHRLRSQMGQAESNQISVRIELQADCYSGVWARAAQSLLGTLEPGDLEEALYAAKAIGDDAIQRQSGRVPRPHTFTHGTSEQRMRWFSTGYQTGDVRACDTFGANSL
ncbi:KPN_02809 family neutral zinc metallopeptidase [Ruegeria atlantica]|uniref:Putative metalloprotease n=1 Tax=Ruegeria atlantica TaxID=81569 RepID=A0A0P1EGK8_9RHOB|nr:neutral zinc metallopeptidase [Ruegeria atlantica]CUH48859.1 putative metalloprotease [Ruegeria atlantica]